MSASGTFRAGPRPPWRLPGLLVLTWALAAQDPTIDLAATPAQVAVGGTVQVVVTYRWPAGWTPSREPDPGPAFRSEYVTASPPVERASTGEGELRRFTLTVAAGRSGPWLLPRPAFSATGPDGRPRDAVAPEVIVQVGAEAAPPDLPAARPLLIRPPLAERPPAWGWWAGLGLAAVAGLGGAAWWFRRQRGGAGGPTALEVLQRELAAARRLLVGATGTALAVPVGTAISVALRRYAGALGRFDGPGLTTRELSAQLRRTDAFTDDEGRELVRVLGRLDDLRWSGGEVPSDLMGELATVAEHWALAVDRRLAAAAAAQAAERRP